MLNCCRVSNCAKVYLQKSEFFLQKIGEIGKTFLTKLLQNDQWFDFNEISSDFRFLNCYQWFWTKISAKMLHQYAFNVRSISFSISVTNGFKQIELYPTKSRFLYNGKTIFFKKIRSHNDCRRMLKWNLNYYFVTKIVKLLYEMNLRDFFFFQISSEQKKRVFKAKSGKFPTTTEVSNKQLIIIILLTP